MSKMNTIIFIYLKFCLFMTSESYRFLIINPLPVKSLSILGESAAALLAEAGHEVTYITAFPSKLLPKDKIRQIDTSESVTRSEVFSNSIGTISDLLEHGPQPIELHDLQDQSSKVAVATIEDSKVKALLEDTSQQFDAIIVDFFETDLYAALGVLYNAPLIYMYSMGIHLQPLRLIDQFTNPAYTSGYMTTNNPPFDFKERVEELWCQIKWYWYKSFQENIEEASYKKLFEPLLRARGRDLPDFQKVIYNASLILANENYAIGHIPSAPQNFKLVGGYHIRNPVQPLPKDLQDIMDSAKNGVIYFSLGSTWQSKDIPKQITENLLKMFSGLKQTVIWKYEEDISKLPKNLHTVKWAPQASILSHPNCLLFITHGGLLSSTEIMHFGVPTIGVPLFLDQQLNVKKSVAAGYAVKVDPDMNLAENLKVAINRMLSDNRYAKRAKEVSAIFHDRVVTPHKELVFWIEHVVRTRGAPHLQSPALKLAFYHKFYLDLIAIILAVFIVSIWSIKILIGKFRPKNHLKLD